MFNIKHKPTPRLSGNSTSKITRPAAAASTHERSDSAPTMEASGGAGPVADEHEELITGLGQGQRLGSRSRSLFERAYGTSLSHVELHVAGAADAAASRMNARAFTYGNHVGFARGEYRPGSLSGDVLLAHELAHVQQQRDAKGAWIAA
jgi:hypothetical protein